MYHICKSPRAYFPEQFQMATSENKSIQLCTPKVKAAYTDLHAYSNGFA